MKKAVAVAAFLASPLLPAAALAQGYPPPGGYPPAGNQVPPSPQYQAQGANGQPMGSGRTEQQLRQAESEDSGRGLEWVYLQAELGGAHAAVESLKDGAMFQKADKTSVVGPQIGLAAGARLLFFTVGARARVAFFSDYHAWNVGPEVGMHIPIGNLEPYALLGVGYTALGGASAPKGYTTSTIDAHGFDVRLGAGLDYYLSPTFSLGGLLTEEIVGLSRDALTFAAPYSGHAPSTSGTGLMTSLSVVAGLHF